MTLQIQYKNVNELLPYEKNSRTHSEEQITQVASSMETFGFTNPILIDENNGIIAGHGRLEAAKRIGLDEVPTITLLGLTEGQKKAYIIADNKLALNASWDEELLKLELETLQPDELGLTGFNPDEVNLLFNGWNSDIERIDDIESKDTINKERVIIKCSKEQHPMVWEAITNAIDDLGFDDIEVS